MKRFRPRASDLRKEKSGRHFPGIASSCSAAAEVIQAQQGTWRGEGRRTPASTYRSARVEKASVHAIIGVRYVEVASRGLAGPKWRRTDLAHGPRRRDQSALHSRPAATVLVSRKATTRVAFGAEPRTGRTDADVSARGRTRRPAGVSARARQKRRCGVAHGRVAGAVERPSGGREARAAANRAALTHLGGSGGQADVAHADRSRSYDDTQPSSPSMNAGGLMGEGCENFYASVPRIRPGRRPQPDSKDVGHQGGG